MVILSTMNQRNSSRYHTLIERTEAGKTELTRKKETTAVFPGLSRQRPPRKKGKLNPAGTSSSLTQTHPYTICCTIVTSFLTAALEAHSNWTRYIDCLWAKEDTYWMNDLESHLCLGNHLWVPWFIMEVLNKCLLTKCMYPCHLLTWGLIPIVRWLIPLCFWVISSAEFRDPRVLGIATLGIK